MNFGPSRINGDLDVTHKIRVNGNEVATTKVATTSTNGLMSSVDKTRLDGLVSTGGEANQNAFSNVAVSGQTTVAADTATDTLTLAGSGVSITTNASTDTITIAHPTSDGSKHVPANGTSNSGKFLQSTATAGTYQWATLPAGTTSASGIVQLSSATNSTSTTVAATASAVKAAYDLANGNHNHTAAQVTFTDGKTFQQKLDDGSLKGPKGDTGATGAQGPKGDVGAKGNTGDRGATGATGPQGATGAAGTPGAQGPIGPKGDTGAKGATGATGSTGLKGTSIRFKGAWSSTTAYLNDSSYVDIVTSGGSSYRCKSSHTNQPVTNTTYWEIMSQKGNTGDRGATGSTGAKGDPGVPGAAGATGPKGATGDRGPAGPQGATGSQGPTGATGAQGPVGPNAVSTTTTATGFTNGQYLYNNNGKVGAKALPAASSSVPGLVQLSTSTSSTSTTLAATPSAVKAAYDLANSKASKDRATIHADGLMSTTDKMLVDLIPVESIPQIRSTWAYVETMTAGTAYDLKDGRNRPVINLNSAGSFIVTAEQVDPKSADLKNRIFFGFALHINNGLIEYYETGSSTPSEFSVVYDPDVKTSFKFKTNISGDYSIRVTQQPGKFKQLSGPAVASANRNWSYTQDFDAGTMYKFKDYNGLELTTRPCSFRAILEDSSGNNATYFIRVDSGDTHVTEITAHTYGYVQVYAISDYNGPNIETSENLSLKVYIEEFPLWFEGLEQKLTMRDGKLLFDRKKVLLEGDSAGSGNAMPTTGGTFTGSVIHNANSKLYFNENGTNGLSNGNGDACSWDVTNFDIIGHNGIGIRDGSNADMNRTVLINTRTGDISSKGNFNGSIANIIKQGSVAMPQGNWAGKIINGTDANVEHGLVVAARYAASTVDVFRASVMWNGSAVSEVPIFRVGADKNIHANGPINIYGTSPINFHTGRSAVSQILWNADSNNDYGVIHKVDGQDVLVLKSNGANVQKRLYANAGLEVVNTPTIINNSNLQLVNGSYISNKHGHILYGSHDSLHHISKVDLNNLRMSGVYRVSECTNMPNVQHQWGYLEVLTHYVESWCMQRITCLHSGRIYQRTFYEGTWKPWVSIKHEMENLLSDVNLNDITNTGTYFQPTNVNAVSGSNYPAPLAGKLEVDTNGNMVYQTYTLYNNGIQYTRVRYSNNWSSWRCNTPIVSSNNPSGGSNGDIWLQY